MKRSGFRRKPGGGARIKSRKCWHDGIMFDSIWEGDCYLELKKRVMAKEITELKTHEIFRLPILNTFGEVKDIGQINVDFFFYDCAKGKYTVADAKPPEKLDKEKKDWFLRWSILQHICPQYNYELYRMHAADNWRAYKPDREK